MSKLKHWVKPRQLIWVCLIPAFWWIMRSVPAADIWSILSRLTLGQVLALAGINVTILLVFTSRWWLILRTLDHQLPFPALVGYRLAGFGLSYFTPGPQVGGEALQVHLTQSRHAIPAAAAVAAVTLDKLFELLANYSFLVIGTLLVLRSGIFQGRFVLPLIPIALLLFLLPVIYLLSLRVGWQPFRRIAQHLPSRFADQRKVQRAIGTLAASEEQMVNFCRQSPSPLAKILAISFLSWVLVLAEYWLSLVYLGARLDAYQVVSLLVAARIAFLLPSPGGLGTLEASQVLMMQALGINPALGIGISLLIRGRDLVLASLGLWFGAILTRREPRAALISQAGD